MRKANCGARIFGIFYDDKLCFAWARRSISKSMLFLLRETPLFKTSVPPRPYACFQVYALFRYGETTLSACTC